MTEKGPAGRLAKTLGRKSKSWQTGKPSSRSGLKMVQEKEAKCGWKSQRARCERDRLNI